MRRLVLITGATALTLLLGWWRGGDPVAATVAGRVAPPPATAAEPKAAAPAKTAPQRAESTASAPPAPSVATVVQDDGVNWADPAQRHALLREAGLGRRSLLSLLTEARLRCGGRCPGFPESELAGLPEAMRRLLQRALAARPEIERQVAELRLSTVLPLRERFALVKTARREHFGDEIARTLYGEEEAQLAFRLALADFARQEAASLPFEVRLARLEALRREHYGGYFDYLDAGESRWERLRQAETVALAGVSGEERTALLQTLRQVFLGDEEARQLAAQDAFDAAAASRAAAYRQARTALSKEIAQRGDPARDPQLAAERDSRLQALRQRWFGNPG
ncbi:lipase secretion chaperone [Chitinimonas lacunae]|uniref:Lipase helper protein n=1 Tax=Chitinimonas lacunae TaxID=1963018 RepID=A0ABV8MU53_9NEIS